MNFDADTGAQLCFALPKRSNCARLTYLCRLTITSGTSGRPGDTGVHINGADGRPRQRSTVEVRARFALRDVMQVTCRLQLFIRALGAMAFYLALDQCSL